MQWNVGKVKITKVVELETVGSTRFILPLASNEEIRKLPWLIPHFATEEGRLKMSIHSLVVETPKHRIVVDTGLGNDKQGRNVPTWNNRDTPFLETMTAAGFAPDSIDTVLCTHLHVDHVGWNTRLENGRWVPTFPNAKYLFAKREYAHWEGERKKQGDGKVNDGSFDDSVLPIVEAGKAVMIDSDAQPDPLLTLGDYPGHTPGSIAINLKDGGRQACFSGDIMHHPIQVYHPDWSSQFCTDQALSAKSRRRLLEDCVATNALLCPAHFPGANAGYIKPAGNAFKIDWDVTK